MTDTIQAGKQRGCRSVKSVTPAEDLAYTYFIDADGKDYTVKMLHERLIHKILGR